MMMMRRPPGGHGVSATAATSRRRRRVARTEPNMCASLRSGNSDDERPRRSGARLADGRAAREPATQSWPPSSRSGRQATTAAATAKIRPASCGPLLEHSSLVKGAPVPFETSRLQPPPSGYSAAACVRIHTIDGHHLAAERGPRRAGQMFLSVSQAGPRRAHSPAACERAARVRLVFVRWEAGAATISQRPSPAPPRPSASPCQPAHCVRLQMAAPDQPVSSSSSWWLNIRSRGGWRGCARGGALPKAVVRRSSLVAAPSPLLCRRRRAPFATTRKQHHHRTRPRDTFPQ